ncbi:MAG: hypothetical protein EKK64_10200 [Neisseriaceae bacterium]|nr:MAG: hypothetical protein EKK64_10200 [Neisseriaceae bacterium]
MKLNNLGLFRIHVMDQIESKLSNLSSSDFIDVNYFLALNEIVCELEKEMEKLEVCSCRNEILIRELNSSIVDYNFRILQHIKKTKLLNL